MSDDDWIHNLPNKITKKDVPTFNGLMTKPVRDAGEKSSARVRTFGAWNLSSDARRARRQVEEMQKTKASWKGKGTRRKVWWKSRLPVCAWVCVCVVYVRACVPVWNIGSYAAKCKSDDADDADCDNIARVRDQKNIYSPGDKKN